MSDAGNASHGPAFSVPNDSDPWSVADRLAEMMAGVYAHNACVELYGYRLYNNTSGEEPPNVWTIHPPEDVKNHRAIDAINLDRFKSAAEIEAYLLELAENQDRRDGRNKDTES